MKVKTILVWTLLMCLLVPMAFGVDTDVITPNTQEARLDWYDEDGELTARYFFDGKQRDGSDEVMGFFEFYIKNLKDNTIVARGMYLSFVTGQTNYDKRLQVPKDRNSYDIGVQAIDLEGNRSDIVWWNYEIYTVEKDTIPPSNPSIIDCLH